MRFLAFGLLLAALPLGAQQRSPAATTAARSTVVRARLDAVRRTSELQLDARMDEAWRGASVATNFIQYAPEPGAPASQRTEVRVLYDDDALWIYARMHDTEAEGIVARLGRRDGDVHSDWFRITIDSYFDRQTGFVFAVNPRGVKYDAQISQDVNEDDGWDAVWDVAVARDAEGWSAEFRIPLSQLRFAASAEAQTWGLNFRRYIARLDETADWAPLPSGGAAEVSQAGELAGLEGLQPGRRLEIIPYTVAGLTREPGDAANPFYQANDPTASIGADLRYGITSNLTLSLTVNPDFGQVEADPSVVNLSGFENFFPERRGFFLEGAEIFQPAYPQFPALFHSRRIGRSPQGGVPGAAEYADVPDATRILTAGKVTGRAGGWTIGLFDAVAGREEARWIDGAGVAGTSVVEPMTNYAVGRVARDFGGGRSSVGLLASSTVRSLPDDGSLDFLTSSAWMGGVDGRHRFASGRFEVSGSLIGSQVRGTAGAIDRIQRSPVHRFNRPDADYTEYDPTATTLEGYAASGQLRTLRGNWRLRAEARLRSPGFEVNDLGFVGRSDRINTFLQLRYQQFQPGPLFRNWAVGVNQWSNYNYGGQRSWTGIDVHAWGRLQNQWFANTGFWYNLPRNDDDELRGGPALRMGAEIGQWVYVESDTRLPVSASLGFNWNKVFERDNAIYSADLGITVRPSERMDLRLGPSFTYRTEPQQFVANRDVAGTTHFVRGYITQRTAAMTVRLNYTFSPTLSLQVYGQPFVASGAYQDFTEVADPSATAYDARFTAFTTDQIAFDAAAGRYNVDLDRDGSADFGFGNPDFNFKQFRSNVVLRWEYNPGSTIFVVWSSGRTGFSNDGTFSLGRDLRDLFRTDGTNTFLVKVSYWLGG